MNSYDDSLEFPVRSPHCQWFRLPTPDCSDSRWQRHFTVAGGEGLAGALPSPGGRGALHHSSVKRPCAVLNEGDDSYYDKAATDYQAARAELERRHAEAERQRRVQELAIQEARCRAEAEAQAKADRQRRKAEEHRRRAAERERREIRRRACCIAANPAGTP